MIRNYFTIAVRNIFRNLTYTVINVSGLALGIACSTILFLMILFLTSFDKDHRDMDRLYRVVTSIFQNGRDNFFPGVPPPLPEAVQADISGIESVLFISASSSSLITVERDSARKSFDEPNGVAYTSGTYFDFFNRPLIAGSNSLDLAGDAVISERFAKKYFGDTDVIGKSLRLNNNQDIKIAGVMKDHPDNTSFPFNLLISFETIKKSKLDEGWGSVYSGDQCYVKLKGNTPEDVNVQFPEFIKKYQGEEEASVKKRWLQPLQDIRYDSRFGNYGGHTVSMESIWAMGIIAIFLVVTACINFVNLSTAVAVRRSKEVGIRKVMGGQRYQLTIQFLSETAVITLLSLAIGVGLTELGLIQLNSFFQFNLHISFANGSLLIFLLSLWLTVSLVAGTYPALLLSGFNPIQALKNKFTGKHSGGYTLRRGLVVFQFMISQFLVVGTIILLTQMNYFHSKDLGFNKEAVITIFLPEESASQNKAFFKTEVSRLQGVDKVSLCFTAPSSGSISQTDFRVEGEEESHVTQMKMADDHYLDIFDIKLVAGRGLTESDTATEFLVNEKLAQIAGFDNPEDILGRKINVWGRSLSVVGVVKDFHLLSLQREIDPVILMCDLPGYRTLAIKLLPGEFNNTIRAIEKVWSAKYDDYIFNYEFMDDSIASFYEDTHKMSVLLMVFSIISILIGCLGLYGLISFVANQKEKEVGVRKALGATTIQIMVIFSKEFTTLIIIAFLLSSPIAGWVMNKWLQNYAYHIELNWTMFALGMMVTLLIAFVAVGYRSLRAARVNPANVLRSE